MKQRVLFLCTHNSARSQMAEGLLRARAGDQFDVWSARTEATHVRPRAIETMREIGVDISQHSPKTVDQFLDQHFDYVIIMCGQANESCPTFFGAQHRLHWSIPDPSRATGDYTAQFATYRSVRNATDQMIQSWLPTTPTLILIEATVRPTR